MDPEAHEMDASQIEAAHIGEDSYSKWGPIKAAKEAAAAEA
jgi:hypothetical protein